MPTKRADYQGFTNWETWNTDLMLRNEQEVADALRQIVQGGGTPEDIRDYALVKVIGPHNQSAMEGAQEWNSIPEEERIDHNWEDLLKRLKVESVEDFSDSQKAMMNLFGLGPDTEDIEPTLIDPELVNWLEIYQREQSHIEENEEFETLEAEAASRWDYYRVGFPDSYNAIYDSYIKFLLPKAETYPNDYRGPEYSTILVPMEKLDQNDYTASYWEEEVVPVGGAKVWIKDMAGDLAFKVMHGKASPEKLEEARQALISQNYSPEEIEDYLSPRYLDGVEVNPAPEPEPDTSLDEPGDFRLPPNWTASLKPPKFPAKTSKVGSSVVHWEEIKPNVALIRAVGGTGNDCYFAEKIIEARLSGFGIDRHQVDMRREAGWHDHIQPKAQRLLRNGQVTVLRNGYTNIIGKVIGDTGEYTTEIWRDDPNSRSISRWSCECAWNQFAWNRTRQWKRIEGRPCSHVLALYWKSLSTPLDDQPEDKKADPGQKQGPPQTPPAGAPPAPAGAPAGPAPAQPGVPAGPRSFAPDNEGVYQNPDFPRPQPETPPGQPLPLSPAEQLNMMTPQEPGQTPPGLPAPPNTTVSVPGARPQTPMNPIQYPGAPGMGGTLSSVKTAESDSKSFEEGSIVRTTSPVFGLAEGKSEAHGAGQYQEIPEGATGEVMSQDSTLGWVEVIFPLDGGELTPYHVRVFCNPSELKKTRIRPPGPFVKRRDS